MLRIAFAGTPAFALPALEALAHCAHSLVGVLTQPDRPAGRGQGLRASPVKERALQLQVPIDQPEHLKGEAQRAALRAWAPDLLVVVAYGLLLPPAVLALPPKGCVNIHASLLPRWRGAAPIARAILAGDRDSGVSIMQMDVGLDTGPVLARRVVPIGATQTCGELHDVLAQAGAPLLLEVIDALAAGRATPQAQAAQGVTYAPKLDKHTGRIDWTDSAEQIARQVRACNPWPVAETALAGVQLRIWRAQALGPDAPPAGAPVRAGAVLGLSAGALQVQCGSGVLAVAELQSAGRRRLSAEQFSHGHALRGMCFG